MSRTPELLPLGSAVAIDGEEGVFVIVARGFQKQEDGGFVAGYKGVPHPQGAAAGVRELVIRHTQITDLVHRGYHDEEDAVFAKEQLENAKTPPTKPPRPDVEPDLTVDLTKPAAVTPPAPAAGVEPTSSSLVANAKDPFSELRRKGKRT